MADLIEREPLLAKMFPCAAKKQVEEAPAVNRPIPCSEKMPEDDKEVLCYSKQWGWIVTAKEHFAFIEVTHWMPLPEPPEVNKE